MTTLIFAALTAGWCGRSAVQSAIDGKAWWALFLGFLACINFGLALFWAHEVKRGSAR